MVGSRDRQASEHRCGTKPAYGIVMGAKLALSDVLLWYPDNGLELTDRLNWRKSTLGAFVYSHCAVANLLRLPHKPSSGRRRDHDQRASQLHFRVVTVSLTYDTVSSSSFAEA